MDKIIGIVFSEFILCLVILNLTGYKLSKNDIVKFAIISMVSIMGSIIFIPNLTSFIAFIVPIYIIYKNNAKLILSISIDLIAVIICILTDYIISLVLVIVLNINISNVSIIAEKFINVIFIIVSYYISYLIGKMSRKYISLIDFKKYIKEINIIVATVILTFVVFYINLNLHTFYELNNKMVIFNGVIFILYFIIMVGILLILIKNINKQIVFKSKQEQFNNLQEYTSNLESLYSDMRKFRHDYINIISSIIGYVEEENLQGLKAHINDNIIPLSKTIEENNSKIISLKNIKIPEIKGIISTKIIQAQEKGIDISIEVVDEITLVGMDIIDFSRVVGILLDNAIEESANISKSEVKIAIIKKNNSMVFLVINKCKENMPHIYEIYMEGFSTKGENRGLGLSSLRDLIGKYNNITIDTSIDNGYFVQNLEIKNEICRR